MCYEINLPSRSCVIHHIALHPGHRLGKRLSCVYYIAVVDTFGTAENALIGGILTYPYFGGILTYRGVPLSSLLLTFLANQCMCSDDLHAFCLPSS